jgi:hypothetical protein
MRWRNLRADVADQVVAVVAVLVIEAGDTKARGRSADPPSR